MLKQGMIDGEYYCCCCYPRLDYEAEFVNGFEHVTDFEGFLASILSGTVDVNGLMINVCLDGASHAPVVV